MKITGNSIKVGNVLDHEGRLWRAMKTQHVMPGKGGAFGNTYRNAPILFLGGGL